LKDAYQPLAALPQFPSLKLTTVKAGNREFIKAFDPTLVTPFVPRHLATYKLLLLTLGLDSNHCTIEENHPDFEVSQALQTETRGCSWDPAICKKEDLIECALADLFKKDPLLFEKTKKVVDFYFKIYSRIEKDLPQLKDEKGAPFKEKNIDRYIPGKEQMLAYCLMKNVQYLWFAAISSKVFCRHLGLPLLGRLLPWLPGPSQYRRAAYQSYQGDSFISVWKEISAHLRTVFPEKKDWASFSGHGMVASFDPDLIEQQNKKKIINKPLIKDLNISLIHSLHGKEMDVFYRKC
jgi:hypothetical protein